MIELAGIKKDDLTNCLLKNGIFPLLSILKEEYQTTKRPFSVLVLDLDFFKNFNDTFGHLIGDEILKYFSSSVRLDLYGLENYAFRFGGDEFVVVFPGRLPIEVYPLVMRLRENIRTRQCLIKGNQIKLSFSGGIASYPGDGDTVEEVMEAADKAMYYSKKKGRARVTLYARLWPERKRKLALVLVLAGALAFAAGVLANRGPLTAEVRRWMETDRFMALRHRAGASAAAAARQVAKGIDKIKAPLVEVQPMARPLSMGPAVPVQEEAAPPLKLPTGPAALKVTVYLKSGGAVHGTVVREDEDRVWLSLPVAEGGKGTMILNKSAIDRIEA